jgi:hypothetical protein
MAGDDQYGHIKDTDTVFMRNAAGVGSCLGLAFKTVYGPQGYTQISPEEYQVGVDLMNEQRGDFVASGAVAPLPDGEPEAADIMRGDAEGTDPGPSPAVLASESGVDTGAPARTSGGRHRGEG